MTEVSMLSDFEEFTNTKLASDCVIDMLTRYNSGISRDEFYSKNIIDTSDVTEQDLHNSNEGLYSFAKRMDVMQLCLHFEEGSFIDHVESRYIHWKVLEIQEDFYRIVLDHYPLIYFGNVSDNTAISMGDEHKCWYLSCRVTVKVKKLTPEEHMEMISHHPDYVKYNESLWGKNHDKKEMLAKLSSRLKSSEYIGGVVEDYEYFQPKDLIKICKKGKYSTPSGEFLNGKWVRKVADVNQSNVAEKVNFALHTILYVSSGPLFEMFTYVNYMLSQKSTNSSTLRNITSFYIPNTEMPELRKERHFGKIKVVSEKKPRSINAENIQRIYTTPVWQRRGHLRHLASGKIVPVKSATCKRHGVESVIVPQVVYKV